MPDVTRSDSQRSEGSNRPRVSFNQDVHVKRIVPNDAYRVSGAIPVNGSPVRKARLPKSKQQLGKEAARVLQEVHRVNCIVKDHSSNSQKFYTLPIRKKHNVLTESLSSSLDRTTKRRFSEDCENRIEDAPKKPPRTFTHYPNTEKSRTSIFSTFKRDKDWQVPQKKSNLRRSVSDASDFKSKTNKTNLDNTYKNKTGNESEIESNLKSNKKQLSPIIEDTQGNNYFSINEVNINRGNQKEDEEIGILPGNEIKKRSVTEQLKDYIDEVDTALFNETAIVANRLNSKKIPEIIIIDVDKAEKITRKKDKPKLSATNITKKIKSLGNKSKKITVTERNSNISKTDEDSGKKNLKSYKIQKTTNSLRKNQEETSLTMIHSNQEPVNKLPLSRGLTVDSMIKRLNNDKTSILPPKTNIMIIPSVTVQHNNNQPFSYTRGHSPERNYKNLDGFKSPEEPGSPVIYAHVVCDKGKTKNSTAIKQTIHTAYSNGKKQLPHSDSDEGLGYEENIGFNKTVTHFGDDYLDENQYHHGQNYPLTNKIINSGNYYDEYSNAEHSIFIDSSSRGRGDGMDSKRRESLTEPTENGFNPVKCNINTSRTNLSARRDLLESRISRRLEEKKHRQSPPSHKGPYVNIHVREMKYYSHGSTSPVGYTKIYTAAKTDRNGSISNTETHSRKGVLEKDHDKVRYKHDNEPKSLDSQISDYKSSSENIARRNEVTDYKYISSDATKDNDLHRANLQVIERDNDYYEDLETYYDSLKREKHESTPTRRQERKYSDRLEFDRKDRFGDSGIENDFKRESTENHRVTRSSKQRSDYCNESEDEGFASSLLIASERQHTEANIINRKSRNRYKSDKGYGEDHYRNLESMDFKVMKEYQYTPRERSIDDGSHYDPRLDKDFQAEKNSLKKKTDKKPLKSEKKSGLEKVKELFSRDSSKKKKEKARIMVPEENLRARYREYPDSREHFESRASKPDPTEVKSICDYRSRRRLSTPSPSPTRNSKPDTIHGRWFKSLDRLSRKKSKKDENLTSEEEITPKPIPVKNLRFFGDTDIESNDSIRDKQLKARSTLTHSNYTDHTRSQSNRELQNTFEEIKGNNKSESELKNSRISVRPPMSPNHRPNKLYHIRKDEQGRRKRNEVSSLESSTEGDSSQQSQRSVVYLHAATIGDIPGLGSLKNGRRAASREELVSNASGSIRPQVKTLSRSFSVLAPWKPRYVKESYDIDYTQYSKPTKNGKYEQNINRNSNSRKDNSSTLKKKANETKKTNQSMSSLNHPSRSKENLSLYTTEKSNDDLNKSSMLYKKRDKHWNENVRYNKDKDDKRLNNKCMSVESLSNDRQYVNDNRNVSRSVSMPRDPEKSSGWFNVNKKNKQTKSMQRL